MDLDNVHELFLHPSAEYRGKPFWAWNGFLKEGKLKEQIAVFAEMGFGGFFMHSRTGLETEYLGDEWFRLVNVCTEEAEKIGIESWIYDEDRWPSGSAGGLVTEIPEYRASFIRVIKKEGEVWNREHLKDCENVIAVFVCDYQKNMISNKRKIHSNEIVSKTDVVLIFVIEKAECSDVYNGNTYLDTMNPEAVSYFLEVTHEKYVKKVQKFEKIKGVFTDEPHRGPLFTTFNGGREEYAPYTPKLFASFFEKYGYHLEDMLPELFYLEEGELLSKVTYDYIELCQELFLESYAKQMSDWCKKHRLLLTGHVLHEDSLIAQTIMQGSLMRFYPYMDYPGVDVLLRDNHCYWIVKQVVSVARQMGKNKVLSELYGATGWQATLEDYKNMGDWQALLGINLRCQHLSLYSMIGESKRDYPASIMNQLPDYHAYRELEDYFSRLHVFMGEGIPECHVLVIHPVESVWARSYSGAYDFLDTRDDCIKQIENQFEKLFWMLMRLQVDFDYGDEALMAEHAKIENGNMCIGCSKYNKIIVSGMLTIRSTTCHLLEEFRKSGGEIIFLGGVPEYVDVVKDNRMQALAEKTMIIPFDEKKLESELCNDKSVRLEGVGKSNIFAQCKVGTNLQNIMLWNYNTSDFVNNIEIHYSDVVCIESWNPMNGSSEVLLKTEIPVSGHIKSDFAPGEMKLYRLISSGIIGKSERICRKESALLEGISELDDAWDYELMDPNICVLDRVSVKMQEFHCIDMEVLRADQELRTAMEIPIRKGEMLQPWYQKKYKPELNEKTYPVEIEYKFEIGKMPNELIMVLEQGAYPITVFLNERKISYKVIGEWIDTCMKKIRLPIGLLKYGENRIKVLTEIDMYYGLESVYLLGNFGVDIKTGTIPILVKRPDKLLFSDLCSQGFPFYSGTIRYLIPKGVKEKLQNKKCYVSLSEFNAWGAYLIGDEKVNVSWAPYEGIVRGLKAIDVILTRKNTLGPLHETNPVSPLCGPESFHTEDENWSESYTLQKQGIFKKPEIKILLDED